MAITSNRIAIQSEIIVGRRDTDEAARQRARAAKFREEAQALRKEFRELQAERAGGRSEHDAPEKTPAQAKDIQSDAGRQPPQAREATREEPHPAQQRDQQQPEPLKTAVAKVREATPSFAKLSPDKPAPEIKAPSLMVEERQPGKPRGPGAELEQLLARAALTCATTATELYPRPNPHRPRFAPGALFAACCRAETRRRPRQDGRRHEGRAQPERGRRAEVKPGRPGEGQGRR